MSNENNWWFFTERTQVKHRRGFCCSVYYKGSREEHGSVMPGADAALVCPEVGEESLWIIDHADLVSLCPGYDVHQCNPHIQHTKQLQMRQSTYYYTAHALLNSIPATLYCCIVEKI